jgi:hypothetical protein
MKDHLGNHIPSDWVQLKLVQLQAELTESGRFPEGIDQLLQILVQPAASAEEKEFGKLLSLIIHDTLSGIDIARRYPGFFERLVGDVVLRGTFLDTLELLELSRTGELEPLPGEASSDLSFLYEQPSHPEIVLAETGNWRVVWEQTADQINTLFINYYSTNPKTTNRGAVSWLDDDNIVLLQDEMTIGEADYQILLKAIQPVDQPEHLNISLLIITTPQTPVALEAYVKWGGYEKTLILNTYGQGLFTAIPVTAIFDQGGRKVTGNLYLEFGPTATS